MDDDGDLIVPRAPACKRIKVHHAFATPLRTVGLQVWNGSCVLVDWLLSQPRQLQGSCFLELGAGVGLPSIVAGVLGATGFATDCPQQVLELLARNLKDAGIGDSVQTRCLDWMKFRAVPNMPGTVSNVADNNSKSDTAVLAELSMVADNSSKAHRIVSGAASNIAGDRRCLAHASGRLNVPKKGAGGQCLTAGVEHNVAVQDGVGHGYGLEPQCSIQSAAAHVEQLHGSCTTGLSREHRKHKRRRSSAASIHSQTEQHADADVMGSMSSAHGRAESLDCFDDLPRILQNNCMAAGMAPFSWTSEDVQALSDVDLFLAADVVYDEPLTDAFCTCLFALMSCAASARTSNQQSNSNQDHQGQNHQAGLSGPCVNHCEDSQPSTISDKERDSAHDAAHHQAHNSAHGLPHDVVHQFACNSAHDAAHEMAGHRQSSPTAIIAIEKRFNFTLLDMDATAPAYNHFLTYIIQQDNSNVRDVSSTTPHQNAAAKPDPVDRDRPPAAWQETKVIAPVGDAPLVTQQSNKIDDAPLVMQRSNHIGEAEYPSGLLHSDGRAADTAQAPSGPQSPGDTTFASPAAGLQHAKDAGDLLHTHDVPQGTGPASHAAGLQRAKDAGDPLHTHDVPQGTGPATHAAAMLSSNEHIAADPGTTIQQSIEDVADPGPALAALQCIEETADHGPAPVVQKPLEDITDAGHAPAVAQGIEGPANASPSLAMEPSSRATRKSKSQHCVAHAPRLQRRESGDDDAWLGIHHPTGRSCWKKPPWFFGRRIQLDAIPQYVDGYARTQDLEVWELRLDAFDQ